MNIFDKIKPHKKVVENYFFMTSLPIISSLIGIIIYPYVISTLGKDSYGLYVFSFSIISFLNMFVFFGFDFPAMKLLVENRNDTVKKNEIMSDVFTAKMIMVLFTTVLFAILCFSVSAIRNNLLLYIIVYSQLSAEILFPKFFFQAIQKMKIVTYIQLVFRLLTIPFILIFIKNDKQIIEYAIIISLSIVLGGIVAAIILWKNENIKMRFVPVYRLKSWFKDATPLFFTEFMRVFKQESVTVIIGIFFRMSDVAIYDLANKIVLFIRLFTSNINHALFPKIVANPQKQLIKKIIRYETILGLAGMAFVITFGYWIVLILGGKTMIAAYPLAIILSVLILSILIASSHINFIFIPKNKYFLVTKNQLVALFTYLTFIVIGLFLYKNIAVVVGALAFSGLCEIFYCKYIAKKHNLL